MVNPVLTILFDIVLVGTAIAVIAALIIEQRAGHEVRVGVRCHRDRPASPVRSRPTTSWTVGTRVRPARSRQRTYGAARRRGMGSPAF